MRISFASCLPCALALSLLPTLAAAELEMSFRDGAPKDLFVLTNTGACPTGPVTLSLDMSESAGKLIFDVTERGAGVQVFQPLEFTGGATFLQAIQEVTDGQSDLLLELKSLPPGAQVRFTIDVDDTIGQREITVKGSEMQGSELAIVAGFVTDPGVFDDTATARVATPGCLS